MLKRFFRNARHTNHEIVDAIYGQIVAAARQPTFYADWSVPDTPLGRFEMMSLHVFLFLHRVRGAEGAVAQLSQDLTDEFFKDVDHSLRELGIGDIGVPKRMKKLAKMFYGRVESYAAALNAGDQGALAEALRRNVQPEDENWPHAAGLAAYAMAAERHLAQQDDARLLAGQVSYPDPAAMEASNDR